MEIRSNFESSPPTSFYIIVLTIKEDQESSLLLSAESKIRLENPRLLLGNELFLGPSGGHSRKGRLLLPRELPTRQFLCRAGTSSMYFRGYHEFRLDPSVIQDTASNLLSVSKETKYVFYFLG